MKMVTDYEVEGCWSGRIPVCRNCGKKEKLVPEKGHYNSQYWELKQNDGLDLFCCPEGCSVKAADKRMNYFLSFSKFIKDFDKAESYNFELDFKKINSAWIDKEGIFYPCDYQGHVNIADAFFDTTDSDLEGRNYIRLSSASDYLIQCIKKPTKKQINSIIDWAHENTLNTKEFYEYCNEEYIDGELFSFIFEHN